MTTIIVNEVSAGKWEVRLDGRLLCTSRQPMLDAARILIAEDVDPESTIRMGRPNGTIALTAKLGTAAKLTVDERRTRFVRWEPFDRFQDAPGRVAVCSPIRNSGMPAIPYQRRRNCPHAQKRNSA